MSCNKPNWILLKECGEKLTIESKTPFTRKQLKDCVHEIHPNRGENSLNPMIQGMTVNLKGGPLGGIGKDIFYSVGRGLFELYDPKKHDYARKDTKLNQSDIYVNATEDKIRDLLMEILYQHIGKDGSWQGSSKTASFALRDEFIGYECFAERSLSYGLPMGVKTIGHTSDILISDDKKKKYVSIEIKHRSAVTDQFKCRCYDMIHLKRDYKDNLLGIMVYVKTSTGISLEHARSICYPFDYFFGITLESVRTLGAWDELIFEIEDYLRS